MVKKPLKLKYVGRYALERYRRLRDPNTTINNEAGTSYPLTTQTYTNPNKSETKDLKSEAATTSAGVLHSTSSENRNNRQDEHQQLLQYHKFTDVVTPTGMQSNEMAKNETKPLTEDAYLTYKPKTAPKYDVRREVLTHDVVIKRTGYGARDKSIPSALRQCWRNWSFIALFTGIIPILQWLPKYSFRRDFMGDVIAGFTVAIMHIPHGMAYGILAGVPPGSGLYMAIFPVAVYLILGTSRHISIGTFAVVSMMTLKVVQSIATEESVIEAGETKDIITPLQVATALAFTVGIIHLIMGMFRLGTLASLLSEPLVNGFTTGAACHVVATQLKDVLGVYVYRHKGAFKIIYTLIDVGKQVPNTNLAALIFCVGIMIFMIICNECLKPCLRKHCRFPLPAELIAVIGGTVISKYMHISEEYSIKLVGNIPSGLPEPELPRWDLIPLVAVDSIAVAIVSYSIVMSMGLTFAKKHSYEVRANQELFALGIGNFVGGCFSCIPLACSLSRSVIQEQTGGATQIASLVSILLILMTLLWVGPFFSALPRCVLAGVIIVALKPMFWQAKELKKFSKQGKLELLTWIGTFLAVVIIDIDIGLLIGIGISLLTLYIKGLKPYSSLLGVIPEAAAVYVDMNHHRNAKEIPETKIFRYTGALNFATAMFFRRALYNTLGVDSQKIRRASYMPLRQTADPNAPAPANGQAAKVDDATAGQVDAFRFLIFDFSMLGHIDVAGCRTLSDVMKELKARGVRVFVSSPTDRVYDTLVHSMALGDGPFEIFPTLHDAVEYANACRTA